MNCIAFMSYHEPAGAIDWLERAFGFERSAVHEGQTAGLHTRAEVRRRMVMLGRRTRTTSGSRRPGSSAP
jgi:uncharacterized glyoxalase superfamily protein PhnB